jgi:glutamate dehydrogenase
MPSLNEAINALDNKIPGALQLELYASVQDLMLDRLIWTLRNVDLSKGLADVVAHYRAGIMAVEETLDRSLSEQGLKTRAEEIARFRAAGIAEAEALRFANIPILAAAPDIVLVSDRTGKAIGDVARTYFAARAYFQLDPIAEAAREIETSDYFDRLALDRARDGLGEGIRQLTAEMVSAGAGAEAVQTWVGTRAGEVERIRSAVHEIARSGLTLSKLSVAASLLRDLARG